jgi:lysophospholipase
LELYHSKDEFTPEDVNVWHPTLNATFPIDYLGSKTGAATNKATECVTGFDNIGLVRLPAQNAFYSTIGFPILIA